MQQVDRTMIQSWFIVSKAADTHLHDRAMTADKGSCSPALNKCLASHSAISFHLIILKAQNKF